MSNISGSNILEDEDESGGLNPHDSHANSFGQPLEFLTLG
jgi:hypothetical protein